MASEAAAGYSRRHFLTVASAGAVGAALSGAPAHGQADTDAPCAEGIARVASTGAQTMQGFGASGAWWPNDLVRFDPAVQEDVADLLFGPDGLALSVYRYNIGGGGVGVTHAGHDTETFLVEPGRYDWNRDPGGRRFLKLAAQRGVPILVGFVNSAPPIWTTTGESLGGKLLPGAEADVAHYLADVVVHLHDDEGITLSYISPMNEPNYVFAGGFQEGMGVPVEQRGRLIRALGRELAARAPYCRVVADESSRTGEHFLSEAPRWFGEEDTADYVAALAHHRYDFPNDITLELAHAFSEKVNRPLWSTEVCCFDSRTGAWGQQYDPTIANGLILASLIWQGLTVAQDAAFHWWVALSPVLGCEVMGDQAAAGRPNDDGWNDGLLYYDPSFRENGNQRIYRTSRYGVLGQFSRYVRPGDRRHEVTGAQPGLRVLAFSRAGASEAATPAPVQVSVQAPTQAPGRTRMRTPPIDSWTVVAINSTRGPAELALQLPAADGMRILPVRAVETSASRILEPVDLPAVSADGLLSARLPVQSVTTAVLQVSRQRS